MYKSKSKGIAASLFCIALASCGSNITGSEPIASVDPIASSTLQFAVGTFEGYSSTLNGGSTGGFFTTLNAFATLRNSSGHTAVLQDTATIYGPRSFKIGNAPIYDGSAPNQILNSLQNDPVFGDGFGFISLGAALDANGNYVTQPLTQYLGGPPAWPLTNDGTYPPGFVGYPTGIQQGGIELGGVNSGFPLSIVPGGYELDVTIPTGVTTTGVIKATATLANATPLRQFSAPSFAPDANGGGTVSLNVPSGVTEAFVQIKVTNQACFPPIAQVQGGSGGSNIQISYYTLMTRTTGSQTLVLPDNLGPPGTGGGHLHTICTTADNAASQLPGKAPGGGAYSLTAIGVDYPAFEASYPQSTTPTPPMTGASGQADVTVSPPFPLTGSDSYP